MADPLTHMPSPFEFWVMIALFMPVFVLVPGYAFHQLEKRVFLPRRRARARLRRRGGTVSLNGGKGTLDG
jgi:hypothetical protein